MEDSDSSNDTSCCCLCCKRNRAASNRQRHLNVVATEKASPVFVGDLPAPLLPGHCIVVTGEPLEECTRFSINFTCTKDSNSDIAFHFNPRFEQRYIVRNTRTNGRWDEEETTSCDSFNLEKTTPFKIIIFIAPREFMVSVNNQHFCSFTYRIPLQKVKYVDIQGEVKIHQVETKEWSQYPEEICKHTFYEVPFGDYNAEDKALPNPFIGNLAKGFQPGWQLEIFGRVKILPHSFYINLQEGAQYWPHPIIPLHLNTRFNTQVSAHSMIRNTWINGSWGVEERSPSFHFFPGRNFHIVIRLEQDCFSVWVDGCLDGEFKLRMGASQVDTIYIQGDLTLHKIFVNDKAANLVRDARR